jgi:hypothetical protein
MPDKPNVAEIINRHAQKLMSIPGVVGLGESLCNDAPCISIYLENDSPGLLQQIPSQLEGIPTKLRITGQITPQ